LDEDFIVFTTGRRRALQPGGTAQQRAPRRAIAPYEILHGRGPPASRSTRRWRSRLELRAAKNGMSVYAQLADSELPRDPEMQRRTPLHFSRINGSAPRGLMAVTPSRIHRRRAYYRPLQGWFSAARPYHTRRYGLRFRRIGAFQMKWCSGDETAIVVECALQSYMPFCASSSYLPSEMLETPWKFLRTQANTRR
jgi:hypothetical protein